MVALLRLALAALFLLAGPAAAQRADRATPGWVRVRLETAQGPIVIALDTRRAPLTANNFLKYVDDGRFNGVSFYRSARNRKAPAYGFIQSGIRMEATRLLDPLPHESTKKTGIRHLDMTISMARREPGTAAGNFFITVGAAPWMDWSASNPGYAAFGRVVAGQALVRRILAAPTTGRMNGTMLRNPVTVRRAVRLDGKAKPTGKPQAWRVVPGRPK
jgi:peptidyl-prolyl cis-trans isomerase A (cyclophilin A)